VYVYVCACWFGCVSIDHVSRQTLCPLPHAVFFPVRRCVKRNTEIKALFRVLICAQHTCVHLTTSMPAMRTRTYTRARTCTPFMHATHTHVHTNAAPGQQLKQSGMLSPNGSSRYPPQAQHIHTHVHTLQHQGSS
jgi:hypothetical protein